MDMSAATAASNTFYQCQSLSTISLLNVGVSLVLADCNLTHETLANLMNNLKAGLKTLDIRDNWGAPMLTAAERAVATQRGWTLLG